MGMIDNSTKLAVAQTVTSIGDTASTNIYDSGSAASSDIGLSEEIWLQASVATTVTSGGAATVQAVLQHSTDGSTWTDAVASPVFALASLVAGTNLLQVVPPLGLNRYLRIAWRVGTAALTAGAFTAFISLDVQRNISRPSAFTVL